MREPRLPAGRKPDPTPQSAPRGQARVRSPIPTRRAPWRRPSTAGIVRARRARHESVAQVTLASRGAALHWIPPSPAAAGTHVNHVPRPERNSGLLGLQLPRGTPARLQRVAVGQSVPSAVHSACRILHAVPRGIPDRRPVRLQHELQLAPRPAAVAAVAAAVGTKLVTAEVEREAHLGHLDAAELDATRGLPLTAGRPAVAGRGGAAARSGVEHVPDEGPAVARGPCPGSRCGSAAPSLP